MGKVMIQMAAELDKALPNQAAPFKWPAVQPQNVAADNAPADKASAIHKTIDAVPVFSCR